MPKILQHSIEEVRRRADIVEVCQLWGIHLKRSGSGWAGKCPFHDEKSASFSVRAGKGAKCFGCGWSGDALKLVMAKEGCEFVEAVEKLASKLGVLLEYERPAVPGGPAGAGEPGAAAPGFVLPAGVDPKAAARAMKRQARYEAERAQEQRLQERLVEAWLPPERARRVPAMSAVVAGRWAGGAPRGDRAVVERLAEARGWPVHWAEWLVQEGLVAWPVLPWGRERGVAFRVDCPVLGADGSVRLQEVGYHQRFTVDGRKSWIYVPYRPADEKRSNEFLAAIGAEQDALEPDGLAGVPALPFVMGWVQGVRLLVLAEGQWDAVTLAGACGWLDGDTAWPEGVCVMGSRGSTGVDTLLAYWGDWLEREQPAVLVLADNDAAGLKWDTPEPLDRDVAGSPLKPTFAERLARRPGLGEDEPDWVPRARRVYVSRVRADLGKDFNDFWKLRRPSAAQMAATLAAWGFGAELARAAA